MTEPAALDCNQVVELVTDYLEGALGPSDSAAFEAHLAECEATRAGLLAAFKDLHRAS